MADMHTTPAVKIPASVSPKMIAFLGAVSRWALAVGHGVIDGHLWATQIACEKRGLVTRIPSAYQVGEYRWRLTDKGAALLSPSKIEAVAQQIADALRDTADRYHRGEISHAQLGDENQAHWGRAAGPIREAVHANLRAKPCNP